MGDTAPWHHFTAPTLIHLVNGRIDVAKKKEIIAQYFNNKSLEPICTMTSWLRWQPTRSSAGAHLQASCRCKRTLASYNIAPPLFHILRKWGHFCSHNTARPITFAAVVAVDVVVVVVLHSGKMNSFRQKAAGNMWWEGEGRNKEGRKEGRKEG